MRAFALARRQLGRERRRLAVAVAGVAFAVVLILMQLGFRKALFASAVRFHSHLRGEVFLVSPRSMFLASMQSFSGRRLYQALGVSGVREIVPVYTNVALWKNPTDGTTHRLFIAASDPRLDALDLEAVWAQAESLRAPDVVLFDASSRPEFGPVVQLLGKNGKVDTEVEGRAISVIGLFRLGTSFGIDGSLITSDTNFLRIFPQRSPGLVQFGLVRLEAGETPEVVRDRIAAKLPSDVEVLTKDDLMEREVNYWATAQPIGFVFTFGAIMGFVVGLVIVYQILFSDVADHLAEYATLQAIGYLDSYLYRVVLYEALLLAVAGYVPGLLVSAQLYRLTHHATQLPMQLSPALIAGTLAVTMLMCTASGAIALRKIRSADPAEIF
ncbi:MAG: ABC transporter permease DevC [Candidatus Binatia bacterium]|nr:ABC transporter permease DevC [Candidatus Binatia bacterium]